MRIEVMTLGEAWIAIVAAILTGGVVGSRDGLPIVEVFRVALDVHTPRWATDHCPARRFRTPGLDARELY
jgi:hypothetical protein